MDELILFLGLQIHQSTGETFLCQSKYTKNVIQKIGMNDAKFNGTPMNFRVIIFVDDGGKTIYETSYRGNWLTTVTYSQLIRYKI